MIGVILATHGRLGQELLTCAEAIVGKQGQAKALGLDALESSDGFEKKLRQALEEMSASAGVLVLVDMPGGTPCNTILRLCQDPRFHYDVVTGVNLPMLLTLLANRHYMPLSQLAQKLMDDMSRHVTRPLLKLRESLK